MMVVELNEAEKVQQFNSLIVRMNPSQESLKEIVQFAVNFMLHKTAMKELLNNGRGDVLQHESE